MEETNAFNVLEKYGELIQYISCLGNVTPLEDFLSVTIRIRDKSYSDTLKVVISVPKCGEDYNYDKVEISWRYLPYMNTFEKYQCNANMDQKIMFDILLFNMTNWKLNNIADTKR